jgi:hypothetical protein
VVVERSVRWLNASITEEDEIARARYRHRLRREKGESTWFRHRCITRECNADDEADDDTDDDRTLDPEQCGSAMRFAKEWSVWW